MDSTAASPPDEIAKLAYAMWEEPGSAGVPEDDCFQAELKLGVANGQDPIA